MTKGLQSEHGSSRSDADEVVEYLQLAGRRYQEHVELLRQEQAIREAQHAPFKPTISAYAEEVGKTSVVRQGSSIGSRLHELHQRKIALLEEEAAQEAQRKETEERRSCPFVPTVTARAERSTRHDGDVRDALHRWEQQRRARQVRRQVEATRNELSTVTAAPRISAYAAEKARAERQLRAVPIEESLLAEAERRRQRQHDTFEKTYTTGASVSEPRFVPAISAYAATIEFEHGVVDRLYPHRHRASSPSLSQRSRSVGPRNVYDEEKTLHCTFQPKLSPQSAELSRRYYAADGEADADPHDRLYKNSHHPSKYRKPLLEDVVRGQPEINDASRRMVEERRRQQALDGDPGALGHSPGSRLYPGTAASSTPPRPTFKKKVVTARDVELQTALTFAPAVSATSDSLWRQRVTALKASGAARNVEEARQLLWRKAERKKEEELLRMRDQRRRQDAAECTFHPKAGRPPHRRSGYLAMPIESRTRVWAQQREARVAELRTEVEGSALADCTFHPHVDPVFPLPREDAPLATGVESFVERQAEARRQQEAKKEWWRPQYARTTSLFASPSASSRPVQRSRHSDVSLAAVDVDTSRTNLRSKRSSSRRRQAPPQDERREEEEGEEDGSDIEARGGGNGSPLHRTLTSATSGDRGEEEVFVQHWTRQPPSTSLTASSFSHLSQQDVPSAESSPRQLAYVVQQPPAARMEDEEEEEREEGTTQRYATWHPSNQRGAAAAPRTDAAPAWRKPLRYRPVDSAGGVQRARPGQ